MSSVARGPHSQHLPGSVELKPNYGSNLKEGAFSFWALRKAFDLLEAEVPVLKDEKEPTSDDEESGGKSMSDDGEFKSNPHSENIFVGHQPRVGLEDRYIEITKTIHAGILYKAKLDPRRPVIGESTATNTLKGLEGNTEYLMKAIYPHREETYGTDVHQLLAKHKFAPAYYANLGPKLEDRVEDADMLKRFEELQSVPLITYHFMQFLPPPTGEKAGYITLEDLADNARGVAASAGKSIKNTLIHILQILSTEKMVHGDLRPNNIMVKIELTANNSYRVCMQEEEAHLVDLKLIDFDWAGRQGDVRYPAARNPAVAYWPGEDGALISQGDDRKMVEAWMQSWPYEDEPMKRRPMKVKIKKIA